MVTASDVAQALGQAKFGTQRNFFQKKCGAPEEQAAFDATLPPLKWGVMYEPVAQALYTASNAGVAVHEFGLLRHPTIPHVGASPDGITDLGVMLEIKCPWRRRIVEGDVPTQYYYQIQAQLAVCGLTECDFFECEFSEPPTEGEWERYAVLEEGEGDPGGDPEGEMREPRERGLFLEMSDGSFVYPPEVAGGQTRAELAAWHLETARAAFEAARVAAEGASDAAETAEAAEGAVVAPVPPEVRTLHWWTLRRSCTVRVPFDPGFAEDMFGRLETVWARTLEYGGDRARYLAEVGVPTQKVSGASAVAAGVAASEGPDPWAMPFQTSGYAFQDMGA
jgi:putative phage-type endonuclease